MYDNTPELITKGKDQHRDDDDDDESEYETTSLLSQQRSSENTKITEKFPVNMVEDDKHLTAIVGIPGSGKSVYMETLRSFFIFKLGFFPFLIKLRKLNKEEKEMTFPEFLFKYRGFSFSKDLFDDKKNFGKWIEDHKSKIIILLDGLDEYQSVIDEGVPLLDMNSSATVNQWISLLLKKDEKNSFLSGIKVVFTSRPSTFNNLPKSCRPMVYYELSGFTDASIKSVVNRYNSEKVDEIFSLVTDTRSNIGEFARNPFMLMLISCLYGRNARDEITPQTTLAELYNLAFKHLELSKHNKDEKWNIDKEKVLDGFWYKLFEDNIKLQSTEAVFIEYVEQCNTARKRNDQEEIDVSLASLETFSFVKVQPTNSSYGKLKPQDIIITPKHRTIQEFHVTRHMVRSLNLPMFETLVREQMYRKTYDDKWMMIRRFLSYFIINLKGDEILKKKEVYMTFFCEHLKELLDDSVCDIYDHLKNHEEKFIDEILKRLKENNILIWYKPNHVDDQEGQNPINRLLSFTTEWNENEVGKLFQAISQFSRKELKVEVVDMYHSSTILLEVVIRRGEPPQFIKELKVEVVDMYHSSTIVLDVVIRRGEPPQFIKVVIYIRESTDDEVQEFFQTIQRSTTTIEDMLIKMDVEQDQYMKELVETFPHFTRKLELELSGEYVILDDLRRFCRKLTEEIIKFDNSKLQTQELKVEVGYKEYSFSTSSSIFLDVVIRRGEPPQFIKEFF